MGRVDGDRADHAPHVARPGRHQRRDFAARHRNRPNPGLIVLTRVVRESAGRVIERSVAQVKPTRPRLPRREQLPGQRRVVLGLGLFALAPVDGSFAVHVLPGMVLLGFGAGMALNPVLLAAMSDVEPTEAGLASGLVNTAFMMGGALGLAVLASIAAGRTQALTGAGMQAVMALNGGYHAAFLFGAVFAVAAALLGLFVLRPGQPPAPTGVAGEALAEPE